MKFDQLVDFEASQLQRLLVRSVIWSKESRWESAKSNGFLLSKKASTLSSRKLGLKRSQTRVFLKFDHISKDCSSVSPLIQPILQVCSSVFQRERKIQIGARPRWVTSRSSLRRTFHPSDQFPVRENTSARCSFSFFSYSFKRNVDPAPLPQMHSGPMQADPMYQNVPQSIVNKGRSLFSNRL